MNNDNYSRSEDIQKRSTMKNEEGFFCPTKVTKTISSDLEISSKSQDFINERKKNEGNSDKLIDETTKSTSIPPESLLQTHKNEISFDLQLPPKNMDVFDIEKVPSDVKSFEMIKSSIIKDEEKNLSNKQRASDIGSDVEKQHKKEKQGKTDEDEGEYHYVPRWRSSQRTNTASDLATQIDLSFSAESNSASDVHNTINQGKYLIGTQQSKNDTERSAGDLNLNVTEIGLQFDDDDEEEDELPSFASAENKKLHREIKEIERLITQTRNKTLAQENRHSQIKTHVQKINQQRESTQNFWNALQKNMESETHLFSLQEREIDYLKKQNSGVKTQISKDTDSSNKIQNIINDPNPSFGLKTQLETFKLEMNWNQKELEQYTKEAKQKEEDNLVLEKYTKSDDVKRKELIFALEKLTSSIQKKKTQLDTKTTECHSIKQQFQKQKEEFQKHHVERQSILSKWQNTITHMNQRDDEIFKVAQKYDAVSSEFINQNSPFHQVLNENKNKLLFWTTENTSVSQTLDALERQLQHKRQTQLVATQEEQKNFQDEYESLQHESINVNLQIHKSRQILESLEYEFIEKQNRLDKTQQMLKRTKEFFTKDVQTQVKEEKKIIQSVEERLVQHEKELQEKENQLHALQKRLFKESQSLKSLRKNEQNLLSSIKTTQSQSKHAKLKIRQLAIEIDKQESLLKSASFQINQMEQKIHKGLGLNKSLDEKLELESQIASLQTELEETQLKFKNKKMFSQKLQHEVKVWERKYMSAQNVWESQQESFSELQNEITQMEQNLAQIISDKKNCFVNHDIQRLEVIRLRNLLTNKLQLKNRSSMERESLLVKIGHQKQESQAKREIQNAQLRMAQETRNKAAIEFAKKKLNLEKLKSKYEMLCQSTTMAVYSSFGCTENDSITQHCDKSTEGSNEDSHSSSSNQQQIFRLIQAAQRKEELQREGDSLDKKIQKKEAELRQMEKTLEELKQRNTEFRKSYNTNSTFSSGKIGKKDGENKLMKKVLDLEQMLRQQQEILFEKKQELYALECQRNELSNQTYDLQSGTQNFQLQNVHLNDAKHQVVQEIGRERLTRDTKVDKIQFLRTNLSKFSKFGSDLRESQTKATLQEQTFRTEIMETQVNVILHTLSELRKEFPEMKENISNDIKKLHCIGVRLP